MAKPLADLTDAELEAERTAADSARYEADYIDSWRQWRVAADAADERLAAVTTEIARRERAQTEIADGPR